MINWKCFAFDKAPKDRPILIAINNGIHWEKHIVMYDSTDSIYPWKLYPSDDYETAWATDDLDFYSELNDPYSNEELDLWLSVKE